MKYVDEYRSEALAQKLVAEIRRTATRPWVLMEVCGGQTHTIVKYGIDHLLPSEIELVHGPGCPVCVTSLEMIDKAHAISRRPEVIFCSFGDMLRRARFRRGPLDSQVARRRHSGGLFADRLPEDRDARIPTKKVVFFAIGFETTAPGNAMAVWQASKQGITNFSVLGFACSGAARHGLDFAIAAQPGSGISWSRPCLHGDGFREYEPICGTLSRADRHHRF